MRARIFKHKKSKRTVKIDPNYEIIVRLSESEKYFRKMKKVFSKVPLNLELLRVNYQALMMTLKEETIRLR